MSQHNDSQTVIGSKTGLMRRTVMQLDGSEQELRRTGVFKRDKTLNRDQDADERREPPAPPTLPEINQDDGGTTGLVNLDSEGKDSARRESHPRR